MTVTADLPTHVPPDRVVDFNAYDQGVIYDVLALAEEWRGLGPIVWTPRNGGHWVILGAEETRVVLSDSQVYSSSTPKRGVTVLEIERELHVPIEMDGDEHRQYRRVLTPLFSPGRVASLQEKISDLATNLASQIATKGSCEFVTDYARPLVSAMFLGLLDWPLEDRLKLEKLADLSLNPPGETMQERGANKAKATAEIDDYVRQRIAERRGAPADQDTTTRIMNSTIFDGQAIPDDKLVSMMRLVMIAGLDTTQSVLSQAITYLGRNPDAQQYVREHLSELGPIVEEFLRLGAPALPSRIAEEDVEIGGVSVKKGEALMLMLPVANRDAGEFSDPLVHDLVRSVNRHLAFAVGPHKCIGAPLARVVLATALRRFHEQVPAYETRDAASHVGAVWGMDHVDLTITGGQR